MVDLCAAFDTKMSYTKNFVKDSRVVFSEISEGGGRVVWSQAVIPHKDHLQAVSVQESGGRYVEERFEKILRNRGRVGVWGKMSFEVGALKH